MENIINNPSLIVSIIGLFISIGALIISYLSYINSNRPFIKLSDPEAVSNKNSKKKYIEISVQLTNFGKNTAEIISARVDTINMNKQKLGVDFDDARILLYPGDSQILSVTSSKVFTIDGTNIVVDYSKVDPAAFEFKIVYRSKDSQGQKFLESVSFPGLRWT